MSNKLLTLVPARHHAVKQQIFIRHSKMTPGALAVRPYQQSFAVFRRPKLWFGCWETTSGNEIENAEDNWNGSFSLIMHTNVRKTEWESKTPYGISNFGNVKNLSASWWLNLWFAIALSHVSGSDLLIDIVVDVRFQICSFCIVHRKFQILEFYLKHNE